MFALRQSEIGGQKQSGHCIFPSRRFHNLFFLSHGVTLVFLLSPSHSYRLSPSHSHSFSCLLFSLFLILSLVYITFCFAFLCYSRIVSLIVPGLVRRGYGWRFIIYIPYLLLFSSFPFYFLMSLLCLFPSSPYQACAMLLSICFPLCPR